MIFMKLIRLVFTILIFSIPFISIAQPQSKEELQNQKQELLKEIENLKQGLVETQQNKKLTLAEFRKIERKIDLRNQVINNIKGEVYYVEKDIIRTYRDIDTLKQELRLLKDQYAQSVIYAYKNRSNYDFLNFLFSANHFSDILKRISYLKTYRSFREHKAGDITHTQKLMEDKVALLKVKKEEKGLALTEQKKQMTELEVEKKEKDNAVAELKAKESELTAAMKKKEKERQKIQNAIAAVIKREKEEALRREREEAAKRKAAEDAARKAQGNIPGSNPPVATTKPVTPKPRTQSVLENTPEGRIISERFEDNRGNLPWPVDKGEIVLHYGSNRIPGKTRDIIVPSDGISIETNIGANVKAIFDGEVVSVSNLGDRQLVILKHGRYFTTYSNLQKAIVSRGQKVTAGQVLGQAGANDEGAGSMDLQMDTERGTINPEQWIKRR